jgi:hypothetical protein
MRMFQYEADSSACYLLLLVSLTLKMEEACPYNTAVDYQRTTQRYIPEDRTLHNHRCENLKSYF